MCWDRVIEAETTLHDKRAGQAQPEQAKRAKPAIQKDEPKAPAKPEPSPHPVTEDVPTLAEARS